MLTQREIANQEKETLAEQERAQMARVEMEKAKGTADMQAQLAASAVGIDIKDNEAQAREAQARGEAAFVELTGKAEATKTEAIGLAEAKATEALGLARAAGFEAQTEALGQTATALVAVANAVADGHITVVPEVLVAGGGGGAFEGLAATLMRTLGTGDGFGRPPREKVAVGAADEVLDAPRRATSASRPQPSDAGVQREDFAPGDAFVDAGLAGEAEHALADDVLHHLVGAAGDVRGGRAEERLVPAVVVVAACDRADADEVDRELAHLGHHPTAEELADRALGARHLALRARR